MKTIILLIGIIFGFGSVHAQIIKDPVKWSCKTIRLDKDHYRVLLQADIKPGWHIYSQIQPKDAISVPTSFAYKPSEVIKLEGQTKEAGKIKKQVIEGLDITQYYFADQVVFSQDFTLKGKKTDKISVKVTYMACDENQCLPVAEKELTANLSTTKI